MGLAVPVASLFEGEKHSAHTADARRVPVSDASQLTIAQSEVKKVVITLHRTKRCWWACFIAFGAISCSTICGTLGGLAAKNAQSLTCS